MSYSEEEIDRLEDLVPAKAAEAFRAAYESTLNAGLSVLAVEDGMLYRVYPDRSRVAIKPMPPRIRIGKGTKFKLK